MTNRAFLFAGIAALFAAPAGASVADFRLPTPTPTPTARAQGPVDPTVPTPQPATPTPSPTPTLTPAPAPILTVPELPTATPTPAPRRTAATPAPGQSPVPSPTQAATGPAPGEETTSAPLPQTFPGAAAPSTPLAMEEDDADSASWPWLVGLFLLVGAGLAAFLWVRRRIGPIGPVVVAEIERPRVPPAPQPKAEPEPNMVAPESVAAVPTPEPTDTAVAAAAPPPLHIAIEPSKLALTLMNATLSYRLTLTNRGAEPLADIAVAADLIGAHAALPREEQLAGPLTELAERHRLAGLAPGESGEVSGELRLPLAMIRPIIKGEAVLLVPLARFRVSPREGEPRCFTVVVGQPSPREAAAIQPIRLDLGPRIYDGLAGRAF